MLYQEASTERYERIKENTVVEWRECLEWWRFWKIIHKAFYAALVLLAVLAGTAAAIFSLLSADIMQVLWFKPPVWAGMAGIIGGSVRLLEAAASPGEKGRFYDILVTETEILLSDLINETEAYDDVVKLRGSFEIIRMSAERGVPRGKGMENISEMAKALGEGKAN